MNPTNPIAKNLENQINYLLQKEGLSWNTTCPAVTAVPPPKQPLSLSQSSSKLGYVHSYMMMAVCIIVILIASYVLMS